MGQITDFQLFIKANKLKQKQVADYLGTSPQFINQVAKGICALSDEKYELLVQGDWDVSMLNIPPYIKVPATMTTYDQSERSANTDIVDITVIPAEAVEEIKSASSVPVVPSDIANTAEINVRKFIEKKGDELEHISPNDLVRRAEGAERVRKTSMMPTFMPGDVVFIEFLDDKTKIIDGHIYYFDTKIRPTMIRRVKFEGEKLRLIAENPMYGDIILTFDDILNIADIVGMFRSSFGNQYVEIEEVRKKKDSQIDKLIEHIGDLIAVVKDKK